MPRGITEISERARGLYREVYQRYLDTSRPTPTPVQEDELLEFERPTAASLRRAEEMYARDVAVRVAIERERELADRMRGLESSHAAASARIALEQTRVALAECVVDTAPARVYETRPASYHRRTRPMPVVWGDEPARTWGTVPTPRPQMIRGTEAAQINWEEELAPPVWEDVNFRNPCSEIGLTRPSERRSCQLTVEQFIPNSGAFCDTIQETPEPVDYAKVREDNLTFNKKLKELKAKANEFYLTTTKRG